jgi:small subunit ribosomal protein S20
MPTLKSAEKRMRTSENSRQKNVAVRTRIKTARAALFNAIQQKNRDVAEKAYRAYCSLLDKSAKVGVITKNTAVRRKGRAANQVRAI